MNLKRRAGESAASLVEEGDVVGLGTGSTAAEAIRAIGRRVRGEDLDVTGIPTSYQSRWLARDEGIPLTALDEATPDLAIDGADQVDDDLFLVKGGGAAHTAEKIVDTAADRFVAVVDDSKLRDPLDYPVPLEVVPDAIRTVEDAVRELGGDPAVRMAERKDGPVVTDNGNLVVDADLGEITAPEETASVLKLPGVVEHGIFEPPEEVHVASREGVEVLRP